MSHSESTILGQPGYQIVVYYSSDDRTSQSTIYHLKEFNQIYPGLVKLTYVDYALAAHAALFTRMNGSLPHPLVVMYKDGVHLDETTQIASRKKMELFVSQFLHREMGELLRQFDTQ